jgi:diguanylate cyclase (GGDEF)-like protein
MAGVQVGADTGARTDAARLQALVQIARIVGATRRFDDLVRETAEESRKALGGVAASISRWERDAGMLRTLVNVGRLGPGEVPQPDNEVYPVSDWPRTIGLVDEGRGYVISLADPPSPERRLLEAQGRGSGVSVAIHVEGRVWGELYVSRSTAEPSYVADDLEFAEAVAVQVAAGIVQADHFARIERLAYQDPLTQLANRRAVDDRLEAAIDEHRIGGTHLGLVLADINRLKHVNDSRGHEAGDRLICAVADAVSRAAAEAPGSLAGRIGGDEFCIVVSGGGDVSRRVGERLCEMVDAMPMSTGVSCGVSATDWTPGDIESPLKLFRLADAAQYRAKRTGVHRPVLAGAPETEPPDDGSERRTLRGRTSVDVAMLLESGVELLDRIGAVEEQARLEVVAEHLTRATDGAAWWVSCATEGDTVLRAVASSIYRDPRDEEPGHGDLGMPFDLADFPVTAAAIRDAGAFLVERGAPGNDPAEEVALIGAGYESVLGAGGRGQAGGWLVEIYADSISLPLHGLEGVTRVLVALALAGGTVAVPR